MEEDVEPRDEDGVDVRGVCRWDGWVGGLGAVGDSSLFGLVRGAGAFAEVIQTSVLVSRIHLAQRYRGNVTSFSAASSSRREAMVGGALARASVFCVGLGVGGASVASGSRARPTHSCDGWVCDLGVVGVLSIFGLVRGAGAFAAVLPTFVLVSSIQLAQRYRVNVTSFRAASSSRREAMVGGVLTRASSFRVDLGFSGTTIASGSRARPLHSCDGWVCDLGVVGVLSIFGLVRGAGTFVAVLPTFVLVSSIQLAQRYRGNATSFSAASSSRREAMVGGVLTRASSFRVDLGFSGSTIVSGSCARPSHSRISRLLTSSLSIGISSLFCCVTQCM